MEKELTTGEKLLLNMLPECFASIQSLANYGSNRKSNLTILKRLESKNLIQKRTINMKQERRYISYYILTIDGLNYLKQLHQKPLAWLDDINTTKQIAIKLTGNNQNRKRAMLKKNVELFVKKMNGVVETEDMNFLQTLDTKRNISIINQIKLNYQLDLLRKRDNGLSLMTNDELIKEIKEYQDKIHNGILIEPNDTQIGTYEYYNNKDIEEILDLTPSEKRQYLYTTHRGLLVSRLNSYVLYITDYQGMTWYVNAIGRSRELMNRCIGKIATLRGNASYNTQIINSVILFNDAKELDRLYHDPYDKREARTQKAKKNIDKLGSPYRHCYLIPMNTTGVKLLEKILQFHEKFFSLCVGQIKTELEKTLTLSSTNEYPFSFSIEEQNRQVKTFVGLDMDIRRIQMLEEKMDSEKDIDYGIVCYKYQEEYYKIIFKNKKNIKYYFI